MNGITSQLARDEFLQMMVAQIQNQDPLEPTSQDDMLGQLAQFSTLEGIEGLNASFSEMLQLQQQSQTTNLLQQGVDLIGKTVVHEGDGELGLASERGRIDGVAVERGQLLLEINGESVPIDRVVAVVGEGSVLHKLAAPADPATSEDSSEADTPAEDTPST